MTDKQKELAAIVQEFGANTRYLADRLMVEEIWRLRRENEGRRTANLELIHALNEVERQRRTYKEIAEEVRAALVKAGRDLAVLRGACPECGLGSNGEFCACDK